MVRVDVKKVGRIPDGGGWRVHGRGSEQVKSVDRHKKKAERGGYVYLHSAIDGFSRLAYTEALPDEREGSDSDRVPAPGTSACLDIRRRTRLGGTLHEYTHAA